MTFRVMTTVTFVKSVTGVAVLCLKIESTVGNPSVSSRLVSSLVNTVKFLSWGAGELRMLWLWILVTVFYCRVRVCVRGAARHAMVVVVNRYSRHLCIDC